MSWIETLATAQIDGPTITNTTVARSILPDSSECVVWPSFFQSRGAKLRVRASGRISGGGSLTLELRFGAIAVFTSGAMPLGSATDAHWLLNLDLTCRKVGDAATLFGQGRFQSHAVIGSPAPTAGGAGVHLLPFNTEPSGGGIFDSTVGYEVDLFAKWSIAIPGNSITLHQYEVTSCN